MRPACPHATRPDSQQYREWSSMSSNTTTKVPSARAYSNASNCQQSSVAGNWKRRRDRRALDGSGSTRPARTNTRWIVRTAGGACPPSRSSQYQIDRAPRSATPPSQRRFRARMIRSRRFRAGQHRRRQRPPRPRLQPGETLGLVPAAVLVIRLPGRSLIPRRSLSPARTPPVACAANTAASLDSIETSLCRHHQHGRTDGSVSAMSSASSRQQCPVTNQTTGR